MSFVTTEESARVAALALEKAAASVRPAPDDNGFQERRLEEALVAALRDLTHAEVVARRRDRLSVPGWDPQPGAFDVVVNADQRVLFEIKIDDIDDSVWDITKLASFASAHPDDCAVVAVAARDAAWARDAKKAGLYETPASGDQAWNTPFLFDAYERSFRRALTYSARPHRLPGTIYLRPLGAWRVPAYAQYELRALTVAALDHYIDLKDGWPAPGCGTISDAQLAATDVPDPASDLHRLLAFAATANGYDRFGNPERLQHHAALAYERWRATAELPSSMGELRSFLFAAQRADHFGFAPDERYVRALIEKIRALAGD